MYDNTIANKIALQYKEKPLTEFSSVTSRTPLEDLNLNWREKDLPESERTKHVHRLHPYMGKFIPQLVEIFLRKFKPTLVYDPFCGSGTTLVEANILGIDSIGVDISAFNTLLTKVKANKYNIKLSPDLVFYLQEGIGNDLYHIQNEIEKIICFLPTEKNIHYNDVAEIISCAKIHTIFEFTDSIFEKKPDGSLGIKQRIRVGGIELSPGIEIKHGVTFAGIDFTQFIGHDFDIETDGDTLVIKGIY